MNAITINITPRAFGNIAAAAMSHGCDVTTYLVRTAITSAPQRPAAAPAATHPAPVAQPAPEPVPHRPVPAGSAGMFDAI